MEKKIKKNKKKIKVRLWKQKLYGIAVIVFSILSVPIADGDATALVLMLPIGIAAVVTKEKITDFDE